MMEPEKGTSIQTYCLFGVPEPTLPRYIVEPWVHLDPSPPIPHPPHVFTNPWVSPGWHPETPANTQIHRFRPHLFIPYGFGLSTGGVA